LIYYTLTDERVGDEEGKLFLTNIKFSGKNLARGKLIVLGG